MLTDALQVIGNDWCRVILEGRLNQRRTWDVYCKIVQRDGADLAFGFGAMAEEALAAAIAMRRTFLERELQKVELWQSKLAAPAAPAEAREFARTPEEQ